MKQTVTVEREEQTFGMGRKLGLTITGGEIILLSGELGAGKTVFCKGIAEALSIRGLSSPTFTYLKSYDGKTSGGKKIRLYHYDAYRLTCAEDAESKGLTEFFGLSDGVCVIEWPENIAECFAAYRCIWVKIKYIGENSREITIDEQ